MLRRCLTESTDVDAVKAAMEHFCARHPHASVTIYGYNPGSIRVRIVEDAFATMDAVDRHSYAWSYIEPMDEEVVEQVTTLLLMTSQEIAAGKSAMNLEFEDPSQL